MRFFVLLTSLLLAAAAPACAAAAPPVTGTLHYVIETAAGSGNVGDGRLAVEAQLNRPQGIATDRRGNLYIADTENHRVRKVTPAGIISTVAGDGQAGMRGDGGPAEFARLNLPFGVAVDREDNLYIADLGNHRVRKVDAGGTMTTVAGTGIKGSLGKEGGPATETQLMSPRNVTVDAAGNLYISEFEGHRVRKVAKDGAITTVAGLGVAGLGGDGDDARKAQLSFPAGLAVDSAGTLYIADSQNHRVRRVRSGVISTWLGGSDAIVLMTPVGVALDAAGNLYVAERIPAIRRFGQNGGLERVAGTGMPGYDGDGRGAMTSMLAAPADVAFDALGNLYIADGPRIRKVGVTATISTVAGDAYMRAIGDQGPAVRAILNSPKGVSMDADGNLFIADSGTHRIRKVAPGGLISTLAGTGTPGFAADGRPASQAQLDSPSGVFAGADGTLLVADTGNHRIRQIAGGIIRTVAGSGGAGLGADGLRALLMPLHGPSAALADGRGTLYITDTLASRVLSVDPAGYVATAAGNASAGDSGDGGAAPQAQLRNPSALALDAEGNLFIADALNNRVRKVTAAGVISTVAGNGEAGLSGDGGAATEARLREPRGVAVDGDGNLYIADTGNHAVRKVSASGAIHTIAGTGAAGMEGDGGPATAAQLNAPWGVALDGSGNLYVTDSLNHRVRKLTPAPAPPEEVVEDAVVLNAASLLPGPVAPGAIVSVFADGIGADAAESGGLDPSGAMRTEVAETRVLFDGAPGALFLVQPGQVNAQVPYSAAGRGITQIEVWHRGALRAGAAAQVVEAAPAIFAVSGGSGQALAANEDGSLNSIANAAARGSVVTLFATGEGRLDPAGANGAPAREPYGRPVLPVRLTIGRYESEILYAGAAPGMVGLMQINARVPAGFVPTGALAVELTVGVARSQPGVTIAVK